MPLIKVYKGKFKKGRILSKSDIFLSHRIKVVFLNERCSFRTYLLLLKVSFVSVLDPQNALRELCRQSM